MLKLKKADLLLIGLAAVIAAVALVVIRGVPAAGKTAVVTVSGCEPVTYPLAEDRVIPLTGKDGRRVTVEIAGGRARVKESDCPDHICVRAGWLSQNGQAAVCVPAGVSLRIAGGFSEVDGVTA